MLGYTEATIARKAEKRNLTADEYKALLIEKRRTRGERKRKARAEREAAENG
jgi:hypothetical protein